MRIEILHRGAALGSQCPSTLRPLDQVVISYAQRLRWNPTSRNYIPFACLPERQPPGLAGCISDSETIDRFNNSIDRAI
jgi:hypothetical protein